MISYLAELVLLAALALVAVQTLSVRRELRRLRAEQEDYRLAINASAVALQTARGLVESLNRDGLAVAAMLGPQIDLGRALLRRFDALAGAVSQTSTAARVADKNRR